MKREAEELSQLHAANTAECENTLSAKTKKQCFEEQSWDSLKSGPFYNVLQEHKDVFLDKISAELPQDKDIQHEIDLVPVRDFATIYFDDVLVHSRAVDGTSHVEVHKEHLNVG
ncbi:hypothetical protein PInf_010260 [Phytophthora infestans]|nr:hypothetical protein PInf_010260 [Phytophthora infestans]